MKLIALLVLSTVSVAAPGPHPFDEDKFYKFLRYADKFDREYRGCEAHGYPPDLLCDEAAAKLDVKLWAEVMRQGKELFK